MSGRRKLASHDGRTLGLSACCVLEVTLGPARVKVAHDTGCPALDPAHPRHVAARAQADTAVRALVEKATAAATTLVVGTDGTEALIVGGER